MASGNKQLMMGVLRNTRKCFSRYWSRFIPTNGEARNERIFSVVPEIVTFHTLLTRQRWGFLVKVILNNIAFEQITVDSRPVLNTRLSSTVY